MNDGTWKIMLPVMLFALTAPVAVWLDARKLRQSGAILSPIIWAVFVMLPPFVGIIIYASLRRGRWQREIATASTAK